jgi:hypothetical protein
MQMQFIAKSLMMVPAYHLISKGLFFNRAIPASQMAVDGDFI